MNKVLRFSCILLVFILSTNSYSQKGTTTFGIQVKPIIPNKFIGTYLQKFNTESLKSTVQQKLGLSFGMIVRQGLTNNVSVETGLNYTVRNFALDFEVPDSALNGTGDVGFVGYEIPLKGLVYIRLGEGLFMNTGLGASFTYFPSDVQVIVPIRYNEYFIQEGARRYRMQGALLADLGFEYRTRDFGAFYLGASYNLPFSPIATFAMAYEYQGGDEVSIDNIRGSYLTVDFRYYFKDNSKK